MWDEKDCGLTSVIAVQCRTHPTEIARVAGLMKQNVPFYIIVGTDQAEMDLDTHNIVLGSLNPNQPPLPLENGARMAEAQATIAEKELDEAGKADALDEAAAIVESHETPEANHNGHGTPESLEGTIDTASYVDLSTFDQRLPNGIAVPHAFFLLGQRVDCPNNDLKKGLLELFAKYNVVCQTPQELAAIIEKYPKSDSKLIILEILNAPDIDNPDSQSDKDFASIPSAGDEYRQEKTVTASTEDKPKRKSRKKDTEPVSNPVADPVAAGVGGTDEAPITSSNPIE
jgi:hypothetical protein